MGIFNRNRKKAPQAKPPTPTSLDFYLKIDGIEGESEDKEHAKEISVIDFQIDAINESASPTGRAGGKVEFSDVGFVVELDKSLISCLNAATKGEHIKTAVLTGRKAGGGQQDYVKWTFSELIISTIRVQDPGFKYPVMVFISLNFAKVAVEYKEQKADGSVGAPVTGAFSLSEGVK